MWTLISSLGIIEWMHVVFIITFTMLMLIVFVKSLYRLDPADLFKYGNTGLVSHTKFWGNMAYFAATVAFVSINLLYFKEFQQNIEMIWLIYLSVVASNNIANKLIAYKYGNNTTGNEDKSQ